MIEESERLEIDLACTEQVRAAREKEVSEEAFLEEFNKGADLIQRLHKTVCTDSECLDEERYEYTRTRIKEEFAKEFEITKITEEPPLSFKEREGIRKFTETKVKWYLQEGIPEEQCFIELEETIGKELAKHKLKCVANPCIEQEIFDYIKDVAKELYGKRTTLTEEEILKLAAEKLK